MISLKNISLRRGTHLLLTEVNWTLYVGQRIGLIGNNGSGKSSLFALLLNTIEADTGELDMPKHLRFAHLAQETPAYHKSAIDYVLEGDEALQDLEHRLRDAESHNDGVLLAQIHTKMADIDAYTAPARAAQILHGLGFSAEEQSKTVNEFSGGWRVRLNLAKALISRSDILLLDEPTNHLDLDAILWLERWLQQYTGTLLLISHDREFLDHVVDHIAHISQQQLQLYTGNYSSFEKQRAAALLLQQASYEKQQKHIAHLQKFIHRFRAKASKARQAQSRIKAIEKMELVSAVHVDSPFQFHFKEPGKCANPLLSLQDVNISYGDRCILKDIQLNIAPLQRIALLGPNGAGKSSLIKVLAGELPVTGTRHVSAGLKIGYFAQHQVDHLRLTETPLEHIQVLAPNTSEKELRTFLGSFGFSDNFIKRPIQHFSGGEKSRLALALIVWQKPNLLLLDEPTNHLDLEMRHALSFALQEYQGAMILVSHDRFLVRTTVDQLMLVANQKVSGYDGDLNDYETWLSQFRKQDLTPSLPKSSQSKKAKRKLNAQEREAQRVEQELLKKLEAEMVLVRKNLTEVEAQLTDTGLYEEKNKTQLQALLLTQATLSKSLQHLENAWLEACEKIDNAR